MLCIRNYYTLIAFYCQENRIRPPLFKINSKNKAKNVLSIRMFTIEGILGYGAFSTVYQVRHNEANKQYAMKVMDKNILIKQKHLHYIITEFRILKDSENDISCIMEVMSLIKPSHCPFFSIMLSFTQKHSFPQR